MAAIIQYDRVHETASITGTGNVTLLGPITCYQSFAVVGDGNQTYYCIADQNGGNWEVGIGTYTLSGTILSRTTVLASSNSGNLVSFTGGTQDVFLPTPAAYFWSPGATSYTCTSGLTVGSPVYVSAADTVAAADATNSSKVAIGFVVFKPTTTSCYVQYIGEISGLTLTTGSIYYLAVGGGITATAPSSTGNIVQKLGTARNTTTLVININNNFVVL